MKKYITILFVFTITVSFAQKKTYNIGILIDKKSEEMLPLLAKLKSEIRVVVGESVIVNFPEESLLVNDFNLQKAAENYTQLINDNTDIILAFGVVNNAIVDKLQEHKKPTILFGAVNKDLIDIDFNKVTSGIKNFTYLIESESYEEDIKKLHELTKFRRLGIVVEQHFLDILPLKNTFDKELKSIGAEYKLIPYKSVSDIIGNIEGIDAIYLADGFFLKDDEIKQLANSFIEKKLPSFTNTGVKDVKLGLMATNQSKDNINRFFRRIALTVDSYISGKPLSEMSVFIDYDQRLTVNFNTAEMVNVSIKYSLIGSTDFVGDLKNSLSDEQYSLLDVIDRVLKNNLSLQSGRKDIELSEQNIKMAKSNYLPRLTANGTGNHIDPNLAEVSNGQNSEFSLGGNVTLQQSLYSNAASTNITIQKKLKEAQQETYNAAQLDLIYNVSNTYFSLLILKSNAGIQLRNLNLTKKNLQLAEQNFDAGQSGKSDVLRFRSALAQNTQAMVQAVNGLEQGFIGLNQLLNNPVNKEIDIANIELGKGIYKDYDYDEFFELLDDPTLSEPFIAFLIEEAKGNAPELKSLAYNLEATERNMKLNGSGRFIPSVGLQGQYNRSFSRWGKGSTFPLGFPEIPDGYYNVGINVTLPIFDQNTKNIQRQTAAIQKDQLEIGVNNTELAIAANVRNGVLNLINQISNIKLSTVSESSAEEALDLTRSAYSNGAINIVQLIDAQNNYLNAQFMKVNAINNYLISSLQLERFLGYYFLLNTKEDNESFRQRFITFIATKENK